MPRDRSPSLLPAPPSPPSEDRFEDNLYAEKTSRESQAVIYFTRLYMQRKYFFEEFFFSDCDTFYAWLENEFFILLFSKRINKRCGSCADLCFVLTSKKRRKSISSIYIFKKIILQLLCLYNYSSKII